jgi:hypothetical protein
VPPGIRRPVTGGSPLGVGLCPTRRPGPAPAPSTSAPPPTGSPAPPPGFPAEARPHAPASGAAAAASRGCAPPPAPRPATRRTRREPARGARYGSGGRRVTASRHDDPCARQHRSQCCGASGAWREARRSTAPAQAESSVRPLRRRAEMIARPARVRMRTRKPCVFARRRLFGWNVRLLTSELQKLSCGSKATSRDGRGRTALPRPGIRSWWTPTTITHPREARGHATAVAVKPSHGTGTRGRGSNQVAGGTATFSEAYGTSSRPASTTRPDRPP